MSFPSYNCISALCHNCSSSLWMPYPWIETKGQGNVFQHERQWQQLDWTNPMFGSGDMGCQKRLRKCSKHGLQKRITRFSKIFKKPWHQSDRTCQLPPKRPNIEERKSKSQTFFWRQLLLKNQIWQPLPQPNLLYLHILPPASNTSRYGCCTDRQ